MAEEKNVQVQDLNQLRKVRREKLADLQANGKDPFVITKFDQTHHSMEIKDNFDAMEGQTVTIAGRMMSKRVMGKASFCGVQDLQGNIQSYVARDSIGEEDYKDFKKYDIQTVEINPNTYVLNPASDEVLLEGFQKFISKSERKLTAVEKRKLMVELIKAKKNTYANGNSAKVNPSRLGSKDYHYEEDVDNKKLCYHDTYFGGEKFIGCEVVYVDNTPIWAMNYNGYSVVENLSEEAMDNALRPALMQVGVDNSVLPVRGPSEYVNGEYKQQIPPDQKAKMNKVRARERFKEIKNGKKAN